MDDAIRAELAQQLKDAPGAPPKLPVSTPEDELRLQLQTTAPPVAPDPATAKSFSELIIGGLQSSSTGLLARRKMPDFKLAEDAPWYDRFVFGASSMLGDYPFAVVGGYAGAAAGTAATGNPVGTVLGAGAGGFGLPMAVRDGLVEAYTHNYASNWAGVWEIAKASALGAGKGAVIGAATLGAGKVAGPLVAPLGKVGGATAVGATELTAMTSTAAALDGRLPTKNDFIDNAVLLVGTKAAIKTATRMGTVFAETGKTPDQLYAEALKDPALYAYLKGESATPKQEVGLRVPVNVAEADAVPQANLSTPDVTNLAKYSQHVYREIAPADLVDYIGLRTNPLSGDNLYLANTPDMAIGQGKNSGVKLQFDANKLSGYVNTAKPGWQLAWSNNAAEFIGRNHQAQYADALQSITLMKSAKGAEHIILIDAPRTIEKAGWVKEDLGESVRWVSPKVTKPDTLPPAYEKMAIEERVKAALSNDVRPAEILDGLLKPNGKVLDPVKYEYITDQDTLKHLIRTVSGAFDKEINDQTRGVVTNKESALEALKLVTSGDVVEHVRGTAETSGEILARAMVLKGSTKAAQDAYEVIRNTPPENRTLGMELTARASIERLAIVKAEMDGVGAEAGRALQILRGIKRDPSLLGDADMILKAANSRMPIDIVAKMMGDMKDPAQAQLFAEKATKATTFEQFMEGYKAALISGFRTQEANLMGNAGKWVLEVPESILASGITAGRLALEGDPLKFAQVRARALAPLYGIQHGALDALKLAGGELLSNQPSTKVEHYKEAIPGVAGKIIRTPFKLLQAGDALFRVPAERAEAHIMAVDRVVKEGYDTSSKEGQARIYMYLDRPEMGLNVKDGQAALARIRQAGDEGVFSQRLGPGWEKVSDAIQGTPYELLVPFRRTPINLVSWAAQRTPGVNLLSARWRDDWTAGGERRDKAIARLAIGTGLALTAYTFANNGQLTGGGLFDKEMAGTKEAANVQKYSVKVDKDYYSIQRMEPAGKLLMVAADVSELMNKTEDPKAKEELGAMLVLLFGNASISQTYMQGMASALNAIQEPERYGDQLRESFASGLVPKIVGQSVQVADPYKREVDGMVEAIQSQLPKYRQQLFYKRNVITGEPIKNEFALGNLTPIAKTTLSTDKVITEALRLKIPIHAPYKDITEPGPFAPKDRSIQLTAAQRDAMSRERGKLVTEYLAPIVNDPTWESTPEYVQKNMYRRVLQGASLMAKENVIPVDGPERTKMLQQTIDRMDREDAAAAARK